MVAVWAVAAGVGLAARGEEVERMATAQMHVNSGSAEVSVHRIPLRLGRSLGRRERKTQRVCKEEFTVFRCFRSVGA